MKAQSLMSVLACLYANQVHISKDFEQSGLMLMLRQVGDNVAEATDKQD